MIEMQKISSGKYDLDADDFIKWRNDYSTHETTRGNTNKIFVQRPKLTQREALLYTKNSKGLG
ncbi:hypothetical protein DPMN_034341 [Dreissena polymorpha]|uniref:Uncharacterized protein n=1 Tax=Dreissena polymorpha TaxID=45954 RepID=A0A9D4M5B2_DREPO|nr:hypothetical protein DPMN_034341 [Dreissena polymorpha]